MMRHFTQPKLSMLISESPHVVIPVQKEINRPVDSSLKNLRKQNASILTQPKLSMFISGSLSILI